MRMVIMVSHAVLLERTGNANTPTDINRRQRSSRQRTLAGYVVGSSKRESRWRGQFGSDRFVALRRLAPGPGLHGRENAEGRRFRSLTKIETAPSHHLRDRV